MDGLKFDEMKPSDREKQFKQNIEKIEKSTEVLEDKIFQNVESFFMGVDRRLGVINKSVKEQGSYSKAVRSLLVKSSSPTK
jgi:hypothetical protein